MGLKLQDKIPRPEIRKRPKIIDITEHTLKQKWRLVGNIARVKANRWTKRCNKGERRDQEDDQAEDGSTK